MGAVRATETGVVAMAEGQAKVHPDYMQLRCQ
jgi:hypothetical protein